MAACLPWYLGGGVLGKPALDSIKPRCLGSTSPTSAPAASAALGASTPRKRRSKRQAWLDAEALRLGQELERLADENQGLKRQLFGDDSPPPSPRMAHTETGHFGSVSPEQINLELLADQGELDPQSSSAPPLLNRRCTVRLSSKAQKLELEDQELLRPSEKHDHSAATIMAGKLNTVVMRGSALGFGKGLRAFVYLLAVGGILFVLITTAFPIGGSHHDSSHEEPDMHTGLTPALMKNIAVSLLGCGLIAFTVNLLQQPLILGYLLGGVLVGPIGLGIVQSHIHIAELSSLGLIFLLFMIGLELDVKALLKMGKVVLLTGFLQFPICAGSMVGLFMGLEAIGFNFGTGPYSAMYCGMCCGISSTMIVVKVLGEKGEMDSNPGRLTIGILIFQDIWAIIVLAIQPNLASPEILGILRTFGMIAVLLIIAMLYAKFVMPAVLYHTSENLELMFVMSLAWCFFICCTAILPFVGLSMELASLIAGVALATFPYSAEFNGKIKYIRDFFITLFFAGLGMQIPLPSVQAIAMGLLISVVVLILRWPGIYLLVWAFGGGTQLGAISTINLSQVSEFALVICTLGMGFGHINDDTMTIIIWTFAILAILASYLIGYNQLLHDKGAQLINKLRGKTKDEDAHAAGEHDGSHEERDIVLLGFHKVAFMLTAEIKARSPQLLKQIHIIDFKQEIMPRLRELGLMCTYGDISSPDVLEHAHHGEAPKIVISTIPDSMLRGVTNAQLIKISHQVWPNAQVIVTAESPQQATMLYNCGADYVLRMAKLCAERLHELLSENRQQVFGAGQLRDIFEHFKNRDKELRSMDFVWGAKF